MLIDRIYRWAVADPTRNAIVQDGSEINYGSFWLYIQRTIAFLQISELPQDSVAVIVIRSLFAAWVAALALRASGLHTIAVAKASQIDSLDIRNISCVILLQGERTVLAEDVIRRSGATVITLPPSIFALSERSELRNDPGGPRRPGGHIAYTSGTTGSYKKVVFDAASEARRNALRARDLNIIRDSTFNGVNFGLWTGAGFKQPSATWHVGGTMVFDQRPDHIAHVFDHGVTGMSLLPPMYRKLLTQPLAQGGSPNFSGVTLYASSGYLPINVAEALVRNVSPDLQIIYSATELIRIALRSSFRDKDDLQWLGIEEQAQAEIVTEDGAACAVGEEGFLRFRATDIDASSYLDNEAASAGVFRDGCFYPGDMAVRRSDGRIRILGRVSDVINLQGAKVAVAPLEQDLQRLLDAEDVCLFAHLDDASREEVIVAVQAQAAASREKIAEAEKYFPRGVSLRFSFFRQFPRTRTGTQKVRRIALKSMILDRSRRL